MSWRPSFPPLGCRRTSLALGAAIAHLILLAPAAAPAAGPPTIAATWATDVLASSAKLHASVNPNGASTAVRFEYLTDSAYQENLGANPPREGFSGASKIPAGSGFQIGSGGSNIAVVQQLSGLVPATTYRYRLNASHGAETVFGPGQLLRTEETAAVFSLPDRRGWELVSPLDKAGGEVNPPESLFGGGLIQAAAAGGAITYSSDASFGQVVQGAADASQYLAARAQSGWTAQNLDPPRRSGAEPTEGAGVPFRIFSADLSSALLYAGAVCINPGEGCANPSPPLSGSGAPPGYQDYYLRENTSGSFRALITSANAPSLAVSPEAFSLSFAGATPDLAHVVLSTCARLIPAAAEATPCESGGPNLYEWTGGTLSLVNAGLTDARLAAGATAISASGDRVYFTATEDAGLYVDDTGTVRLVASGGAFQSASVDGRFAVYTKAGSLYRYDAVSQSSQPVAAEVQGVLGVSADGSRVYYSTAAGIFLWHEGAITEVASGTPLGSDYPPATGSARVSADGLHLLFSSEAPLTGFDNLDAQTGEADAELFLFNSPSSSLTCVSCNPTNERPIGSASVPGAIANGSGALATQVYKPRTLSSAATRVFFDSADALALQDTNNRRDVYQWEAQGTGTCAKAAGCIALISSGRGPEDSRFIDASADGADTYFLTSSSLVANDPGSYDLYDARVEGGFPIPPLPIPCEGDACQALPSPPEDPQPGTLVQGPGNPPVRFHKARKHHKRHHNKRHHSHRAQAQGRGRR